MPDVEVSARAAAPCKDSVVRAALREALAALGGATDGDELAYLAATSKVEGPVRDRLAWELHRRLGDQYRVAREWRRADLAVLTAGGDLVAQVEVKVLTTFTTFSDAETERYLGYLIADAAKMVERGPSDRYLLSVVYDVRTQVPEDLEGIVKYSDRINSCLNKDAGLDIRAEARSRWVEALDDEAELTGETDAPVEVGSGEVWGLDVSVDCFLTGPL